MTAGGYVFPRARTRDPVTSHLAAAQVTTVGTHYAQIHDALTLYGPAGKDRIAALAGLDPVQVCRRLLEMRQLGLVGLTGETVQSRSGRAEREWQAIDLSENLSIDLDGGLSAINE